ncbi:MAG: hypothetical protein NUW37_05175 [Planctomycetes bacterium]|nr:hypothetical protein [Planctomycetota bacterium]
MDAVSAPGGKPIGLSNYSKARNRDDEFIAAASNIGAFEVLNSTRNADATERAANGGDSPKVGGNIDIVT